MMIKRQYNALRTFIMNEVMRSDELTLISLLEKARKDLIDAIDSDVAWYVLQVKLDLEARELIESISPIYQKRLLFIRPTSQGVKKLKLEGAKLNQ